MLIKAVQFDGENEAEVLVSDGNYEILCYAYPYCSVSDKEEFI